MRLRAPRQTRLLTVLPLLFAVACAGHRPAPAPAPGPLWLTVVGTNDIHGWVQPRQTRMSDGSILASGGSAVFAAHLARIRAENPGGVLLLDAGDLFQGTLAANHSEGEVVISAYNALAYDAVAVGNHEFDYGPLGPRSVAVGQDDPLGALAARARQARFPLLARNLYWAEGSGRPSFLDPDGLVIFERHGLKVGVVGLLTPQTPQVTNPVNVAALRFAPMAQEALSGAAELRRQGADVLIAAVHAGGRCKDLSDPRALDSCDLHGEIFQLLGALPAGLFDAVLAGHTHAQVGHFVNGMPVIESGSYGMQFGRIDLYVDPVTRRPLTGRTRVRAGIPICERVMERTGDCDPKKWKPGSVVKPVLLDGKKLEPDPALVAVIAPFLERVRSEQSRSLHVNLPGPLLREQFAESALGNALADALRRMEGADLALLNSGGLRADLPKGELTNGALFEVLPFDNSVATLLLTGDEFVGLLEALLSSGHGAPQTSGVRFVVERCEERARVVSIGFNDGRLFDRAATYRLVTNDFLALGGDGLGPLLNAVPAVRKDLGHGRNLNMRAALATWLEHRGGTLEGRIDQRMVIRPVPGCIP